ncbi:bicarbonate transport ATP-binding protein CmpD [bacterium BMS3Abin08]|nr:bicarbonate transport ATP-binding protein CmpD [bacterium BMS3Abin08]
MDTVKEKKGHLKAVKLIKRFHQAGREPLVVLKDCSLSVEPGKLNVLIGTSGCGKSTLANILAGYDRPNSGRITMDGTPLNGSGPDRLMVFQETALWPWMTVIDNVIFGPTVRGEMSKKKAKLEATRILELVGLQDFCEKYPAQLSGGMQRRAELARALINNPKVMIMDEPFRGLDDMTRELMQEYYLKIFDESHCTTLFITAEIEEAIFLADRILIMTYLPGSIKTVIEVDLPRPRDYRVLTSKRYLEIKGETLECLHEEGQKSFGDECNIASSMVAEFRRLAKEVE